MRCYQQVGGNYSHSVVATYPAVVSGAPLLEDYLGAMAASVVDSICIHALIAAALVDDIKDRELFMKGIDYSYYYEVVDEYRSFPRVKVPVVSTEPQKLRSQGTPKDIIAAAGEKNYMLMRAFSIK